MSLNSDLASSPGLAILLKVVLLNRASMGFGMHRRQADCMTDSSGESCSSL